MAILVGTRLKINGDKTLDMHSIERTENGVVIFNKTLFGRNIIEEYQDNEIKTLCVVNQDDMQNKSVIKRAIVGSLLGPIGAIVGGISGIGQKCINQNLFILELKNGKKIVYEITDKNIDLEKTKREWREIYTEEDIDSTNEQKNYNDNLTQLKTLKELLDMGAITEEEYNKKKQELL